MFFEQVATITRDHAREHYKDYLDLVNAQFEIKVPLIMPKSFDVSSLVGGVAGVDRNSLPAFAVDAFTKSIAVDVQDLNTYLYGGHFIGLVGAENAPGVERLVKRHGAAVEMFIREHQYLPHDPSYPFMIIDLNFVRTEFFGAANIEKEGQTYWIDGFRIDVSWTVSENAASQHA